MKIALIHFYLATSSGDPRMILSIAKELKKSGHLVQVYCAEFNPSHLSELNRGLKIIVVPPQAPLGSVLGAEGSLNRIIERIRRIKLHMNTAARIEKELDLDFDYIFCENDYSYQIGLAYKKRNPSAKIIWIMNNPPFSHSPKKNPVVNLLSICASSFEARLAKKFSKGIDWAIVYSRENKISSEKIGIPAKLIGNPLDYEYFYSPIKTITPGNSIEILSVGALSPLRRFEDVIMATEMLKNDGYKVKTTIVCKDYWSQNRYREKFEKLIKGSSASSNITAYFDGVSETEMMNLLKRSHVSVVPNNARVWVATACEAMAAGMPLIINRKTVMAEVLEDNKNALFIDPLKADQIATKIKTLIDSPDLYQKIANDGQKFVRENLSFSYFIKKSMEVV